MRAQGDTHNKKLATAVDRHGIASKNKAMGRREDSEENRGRVDDSILHTAASRPHADSCAICQEREEGDVSALVAAGKSVSYTCLDAACGMFPRHGGYRVGCKK